MSDGSGMARVSSALRLNTSYEVNATGALPPTFDYVDRIQSCGSDERKVELYDEHMDFLRLIHKTAGELINWSQLAVVIDPAAPTPDTEATNRARIEKDRYIPGLMDTLLFRSGRKQQELADLLRKAESRDAERNKIAMDKWQDFCSHCEAMRKMARNVLTKDVTAWAKALSLLRPFNALIGVVKNANVTWESNDRGVITILVDTENLVPVEVLTLTKRGKLSVKSMAQKQRWEFLEDVICAIAIRAARELFMALPARSVIVNCVTKGINSETGRMTEVNVLSIYYRRDEFLELGFDNLDPSDSFRNFRHNKEFKRGEGFRPVERVTITNDLI